MVFRRDAGLYVFHVVHSGTTKRAGASPVFVRVRFPSRNLRISIGPDQRDRDKLGFMAPPTISHSIRLTPEEAAAAIDALVRIGWMTNSMSERNRKSNHAIRERLHCSMESAERIWHLLRDQNVIDLRSESNLSESGSMYSRWRWCKLEETFA